MTLLPDSCSAVQIACLTVLSLITLYLLLRWTEAANTPTWSKLGKLSQRTTTDITAGDEVIFITGCDSGIGLQLAKLCYRLGFEVYAGCLHPDGPGARDLSGSETSSRVHVVDLDITDEVKVRNAYELLDAKLGDKGLWCLVNNAGVLCYGEFEWLTWEQCLKQMDVNLVGTVRVTKSFLPLIIKRKGRIVTVTSVNGLLSYPLQSVYCATKFALEGFCDSLRLEIRRHDAHVATLQLGDFARLTNILSNHTTDAQIQWDLMTPHVRDRDGNYFGVIQKQISRHSGITSPLSFEMSPLFGDFQHAVFARKPNNRYLCMSWKQRVFFTLLTLVPHYTRDAFIMLVYRKMTRDDN